MTYAVPLPTTQVQAAQSQALTVANSATTVIGSNKFVFFAAFDGTNNDRNNPSLAGDRQMTNVGVLEDLVQRGNSLSANVQTRYYEGVGTSTAQALVTGGTDGAGAGQFLPTQQMQAIADRAYDDFKEKALNWLAADPSRSAADITTSIVGFSRGAPTGVIFSQLIAERGLTAADGSVLIAPGATRVSSMLLIDPVSTGYLGNLAIPDGATNITVMRAQDEKRFQFEADNYSNDTRVRTISYIGNHGDGGGFYDRGLGAIYLAAQKEFLNNSGIATAAIPQERTFDPSASVVQHDEGKDSKGFSTWGEYADNESRGLKNIAAPVIRQDINSITEQDNGDTTTTRTVNYKNGLVAQQLVDGQGEVVLAGGVGESLMRDAATGVYSISNQATQASRSYNPVTELYTDYSPDKGGIVVDKFGQVRSLLPSTSPAATPSVRIDGEDYKIAANGQLYQEQANGTISFKDALSNSGTVSAKGLNDVVTPIAFYSTQENALGLSVTTTRDLEGNLIATKSLQTYDDGSTLTNTTYPSGASSVLTTATDQTSRQTDYSAPSDPNQQTITERAAGGAITSTKTITPSLDENNNPIANTYDIVQRDVAGIILGTGVRVVNPADGGYLDDFVGSATAANPQGTFDSVATSALGVRSVVLDKTAIQNLSDAATGFNAAYGLIQAIQNHQPLPVFTNGLALYNNLIGGVPPQLLGVSGALGAASSLYNFTVALEHGDYANAVVAGANTFVQGVNAYVSIAYKGDFINAAADGFGGVLDASRAIGDALPFLNVANDLSDLRIGVTPQHLKCYQVNSWSRPYLLGYRTKRLSKMASNDANFRVQA